MPLHNKHANNQNIKKNAADTPNPAACSIEASLLDITTQSLVVPVV
jgi:hypothetical protein